MDGTERVRGSALLGVRASDLPVTGSTPSPPDPEGTIDALSKIGYSLEESLADLVDNSVDAGARHVLIRFIRHGGELRSLAVVDDGDGMSSVELDTAMKFGRRTGKDETKLGKYGMGLKAASFGQCRSLTVITRKGARVTARKWSIERIRSEGWLCELIDDEAAGEFIARDFGAIRRGTLGTLVQWDDLNAFRVAHGRADDVLEQLYRGIDTHLGLHFHRYIGRRKLAITMDTLDATSHQVSPPRPVTCYDPFGYRSSGRRGYPRKLRCTLPAMGVLMFNAHIWPPKSTLPGYKLGGKVSQRQGFYFYRNDRLIQAGGWNGLRNDVEPHLSLARVSVELPAAYDSAFGLNVQKSKVLVPHAFVEAAPQAKNGSVTFSDYLQHAEEAYGRQREKAAVLDVYLPSVGVRIPLRNSMRAAAKRLGCNPLRVKVRWEALGEGKFFEVRPEESLVVLNEDFRRGILGGRHRRAGDVPLLKTLVCLLLQEHFERTRTSRSSRLRLDLWQSVLAEAARAEA